MLCSSPPGGPEDSSLLLSSGFSLALSAILERRDEMHSGTLISDLFALVERTQRFANPPWTSAADLRRLKVVLPGNEGAVGTDSSPPVRLESEEFA